MLCCNAQGYNNYKDMFRHMRTKCKKTSHAYSCSDATFIGIIIRSRSSVGDGRWLKDKMRKDVIPCNPHTLTPA